MFPTYACYDQETKFELPMTNPNKDQQGLRQMARPNHFGQSIQS